MNSPGFVLRSGLLVALAAGLTACTTTAKLRGVPLENLVIPDTFVRQFVGADNLNSVIGACLPSVPFPNAPARMLARPPGSVQTLSSPTVRSHLVIAGNQAVCIDDTTAGFPVLPVEAFERFVSFQGVPRVEQQQWFRQLANALATKGTVELWAANGSGGFHVISFGAVQLAKGQIFITRRFVAAGSAQEAPSPDAVKVSAAGMTGLTVVTPNVAPAGQSLPGIRQGGVPTFSDAGGAQTIQPPLPVRIERSTLSDLPAPPRP
jgi:hypothetical protein